MALTRAQQKLDEMIAGDQSPGDEVIAPGCEEEVVMGNRCTFLGNVPLPEVALFRCGSPRGGSGTSTAGRPSRSLHRGPPGTPTGKTKTEGRCEGQEGDEERQEVTRGAKTGARREDLPRLWRRTRLDECPIPCQGNSRSEFDVRSIKS
jgi:hypothetical protein